MLSIVSDGRCLLYSLLQSATALLPSAGEADELRARLRQRLLTLVHGGRVGAQRTEAAERGLHSPGLRPPLEPRVAHHAPAADTITLWQDLAPATDVFLLKRSTYTIKRREEVVERVPCRGTVAEHAVVLVLTWEGVGHYELIAFLGVIALTRTHAFIQHLDQLHQRYVSKHSKVGEARTEEAEGERRWAMSI